MSAAADKVRLYLLQERARHAMAHARKLADHIQRQLDEGAEPAWFMLREFDRRYDAIVTALSEVAIAEAGMSSDLDQEPPGPAA